MHIYTFRTMRQFPEIQVKQYSFQWAKDRRDAHTYQDKAIVSLKNLCFKRLFGHKGCNA